MNHRASSDSIAGRRLEYPPIMAYPSGKRQSRDPAAKTKIDSAGPRAEIAPIL